MLLAFRERGGDVRNGYSLGKKKIGGTPAKES